MRLATRISLTTFASAALAAVLIAAPQAHAQARTIVTTAVEAGSFDTLVTAVKAAGLEEALSGDGPFTVFAPTDEAFAKLPEGTLDSLLNDIETLTAILTYHVVPGRKMASDVVGVSNLETLNGRSLSIELDEDAVEVAGSRVVQTDIDAGNGVIHVIDTVMLPDSE